MSPVVPLTEPRPAQLVHVREALQRGERLGLPDASGKIQLVVDPDRIRHGLIGELVQGVDADLGEHRRDVRLARPQMPPRKAV